MIHVIQNDQQLGPFPEEDLRQRISSGEIRAEALGWREGLTDWQPLSTLLGIATSTPPPAPIGVQQPTSNQFLEKAIPVAKRAGAILLASVRRPSYVILWICFIVFWFQGCQMQTLAEQKAALESVSSADSMLANLVGLFTGDPITPAISIISDIANYASNQEALEAINAAYCDAAAWQFLAFVVAFFTLLVMGIKWLWRRRKARAA